MEHLLAADVLLGEQAALPLTSSSAYTTTANSVFYFASRVVDKLWHGEEEDFALCVSNNIFTSYCCINCLLQYIFLAQLNLSYTGWHVPFCVLFQLICHKYFPKYLK